MEAHMGRVIPAPVTTKGSVVQVLSPENCDVDILDDGRTIRDFIDNKMKELGSADNEKPFYVASLHSIFEKHLRWRTSIYIENLLGLQMRLLDIGGGFTGIEDCQVDFEAFSEDINGALEEFFPPDSGVQIIAEPGRYYVDSAFTLAANVIAKRVIADDMDEHSDGGNNSPDRIMMYYLNDRVYGSLSCLINDATYTNIKPYLNRVVESSEQRYRSVLWGPTCVSADNMSAYSVSLSTEFNGFERAHIYPVVTAKTWHILNLSDIYNIRQ